MTITFTGTRAGMTDNQRHYARKLLDSTKGTVHHGGCKGADRDFHLLANITGHEIEIHPGDVDQAKHYVNTGYLVHAVKPYLSRNKAMVNLCNPETDLVMAAPETLEEQLRSGTWSTIRYAEKCGFKRGSNLIILEP